MSKKQKQYEQVIEVMEHNNGYATLGFLNQNVDVSKWRSKSPFASIRRIVQDKNLFFKIKPGLWALKLYKNKLPEYVEKFTQPEEENKKASHAYYQGLLIEIGNWNKEVGSTFIPNQDKNKYFLEKKLSEIRTIDKIHSFGYDNFVKEAKTIDVSWFNHRKMPFAFFEVEHSTTMDRSLIKFNELIDFNTKFFIIADIVRKKEFDKKIKLNTFKAISKKIIFYDYERLSQWHSSVAKANIVSPL